MSRWPTLAGLACLLALTQAWAEDVTVAPKSSPKPHQTKAKSAKPAALTAATLADVPFSDPYASPLGSGKGKGAEFLLPDRPVPVEPHGGFSIKAGRDTPDAPMRGGLMFRF